MSFEIKDHKCKICKMQAQNAQIDRHGILHYACGHHYMDVWKVIEK